MGLADNYDVVIAGGGNAALCAAITAARSGRSVVVQRRRGEARSLKGQHGQRRVATEGHPYIYAWCKLIPLPNYWLCHI